MPGAVGVGRISRGYVYPKDSLGALEEGMHGMLGAVRRQDGGENRECRGKGEASKVRRGQRCGGDKLAGDWFHTWRRLGKAGERYLWRLHFSRHSAQQSDVPVARQTDKIRPLLLSRGAHWACATAASILRRRSSSAWTPPSRLSLGNFAVPNAQRKAEFIPNRGLCRRVLVRRQHTAKVEIGWPTPSKTAQKAARIWRNSQLLDSAFHYDSSLPPPHVYQSRSHSASLRLPTSHTWSCAPPSYLPYIRKAAARPRRPSALRNAARRAAAPMYSQQGGRPGAGAPKMQNRYMKGRLPEGVDFAAYPGRSSTPLPTAESKSAERINQLKIWNEAATNDEKRRLNAAKGIGSGPPNPSATRRTDSFKDAKDRHSASFHGTPPPPSSQSYGDGTADPDHIVADAIAHPPSYHRTAVRSVGVPAHRNNDMFADRSDSESEEDPDEPTGSVNPDVVNDDVDYVGGQGFKARDERKHTVPAPPSKPAVASPATPPLESSPSRITNHNLDTNKSQHAPQSNARREAKESKACCAIM